MEDLVRRGTLWSVSVRRPTEGQIGTKRGPGHSMPCLVVRSEGKYPQRHDGERKCDHAPSVDPDFSDLHRTSFQLGILGRYRTACDPASVRNGSKAVAGWLFVAAT